MGLFIEGHNYYQIRKAHGQLIKIIIFLQVKLWIYGCTWPYLFLCYLNIDTCLEVVQSHRLFYVAENKLWFTPDCTGNGSNGQVGPSPRAFHVTVAIDCNMFIFGGRVRRRLRPSSESFPKLWYHLMQRGKRGRRATWVRSCSSADEPWRNFQVGITTRIHEQNDPNPRVKENNSNPRANMRKTQKYIDWKNFTNTRDLRDFYRLIISPILSVKLNSK